MNEMLLEFEVKKDAISKFPNAISNRFGIYAELTNEFARHNCSFFTSKIDLHENRDKSTCQWQHTINAATKRIERERKNYYEINRVRSTINYRLSNEDKAMEELKGKLFLIQFYVRST